MIAHNRVAASGALGHSSIKVISYKIIQLIKMSFDTLHLYML